MICVKIPSPSSLCAIAGRRAILEVPSVTDLPWWSRISPARTLLCGCSLWRTWSCWKVASWRVSCPVLVRQSATEVTVRSWRSPDLHGCAVRRGLFIFQTGFLFLWGNLFAVSDVIRANSPLVNQCTESETFYTGADMIRDSGWSEHTHTGFRLKHSAFLFFRISNNFRLK